jgi:hypothetical protein
VGYWFWGRPSPEQLWLDLQEITKRIKADYDPTLPEVRAATYEAAAASGLVFAGRGCRAVARR